ncbi:MAG: response regulator transcription factor [Deltaproteobacteria bacterium]|jgi:DNA-binding response OmpR family regulator|nr:response regulator transcription factor [Deltaproteobacteria bacterium]
MHETILLVEDDESVLAGNAAMLRRRSYFVIEAADAAGALSALSEGIVPDAAVIDILLPDGNGLDLIAEIRKTADVPVLLLTGLAAPENVVEGLSRGGDDYLTKPYDFSVFAARIEALLRRTRGVPGAVKAGALSFDMVAGRASLRGRELGLSPKEFAVLLMLARNGRRPVSAGSLYGAIWGGEFEYGSGAVKTVVSRLRRKLGDSFTLEHDAVEGGYLLNEMPE